MVIVRATRKLLQRLGPVTAVDEKESTSLLGDWYATVLPWRPRQVALLVSQSTLVPVLMRMAPAATPPGPAGGLMSTAPDGSFPQLQLLQEVWGPAHETENNYLRVHMANRRRKLERDPSRPRHLLTEPGMGYPVLAGHGADRYVMPARHQQP